MTNKDSDDKNVSKEIISNIIKKGKNVKEKKLLAEEIAENVKQTVLVILKNQVKEGLEISALDKRQSCTIIPGLGDGYTTACKMHTMTLKGIIMSIYDSYTKQGLDYEKWKKNVIEVNEEIINRSKDEYE